MSVFRLEDTAFATEPCNAFFIITCPGCVNGLADALLQPTPGSARPALVHQVGNGIGPVDVDTICAAWQAFEFLIELTAGLNNDVPAAVFIFTQDLDDSLEHKVFLQGARAGWVSTAEIFAAITRRSSYSNRMLSVFLPFTLTIPRSRNVKDLTSIVQNLPAGSVVVELGSMNTEHSERIRIWMGHLGRRRRSLSLRKPIDMFYAYLCYHHHHVANGVRLWIAGRRTMSPHGQLTVCFGECFDLLECHVHYLDSPSWDRTRMHAVSAEFWRAVHLPARLIGKVATFMDAPQRAEPETALDVRIRNCAMALILRVHLETPPHERPPMFRPPLLIPPLFRPA